MSSHTALPIVIAHRGASAYLPEHTLEGKALAYGLGADYLEQDVVATKDGALVVLHDLFLEFVTDVALRFPGRCRSDGHFYVIDFLLEELRQLNVNERRHAARNEARYPNRFPFGVGRFRIATLGEEIELVQGLNAAMGRGVGIYPEIKHPRWHRQHGIDLGANVIAELARYGYLERSDAAFVQCFDAQELRRLRHEIGTRLPLVQLVDEQNPRATFTEKLFAEWAGSVDAVGWPFRYLVQQPDRWPGGIARSDIGRMATGAGLAAHAYTFRQEDLFPGSADLAEMMALFLDRIEVQGVFCDHPDAALRARRVVYGERSVGS